MILIINNESHYLHDICRCVRKLGVKYRTYDKKSLKKGDPISPSKLKQFSGIILSGGPTRLADNLKIEDVFLVRETRLFCLFKLF